MDRDKSLQKAYRELYPALIFSCHITIWAMRESWWVSLGKSGRVRPPRTEGIKGIYPYLNLRMKRSPVSFEGSTKCFFVCISGLLKFL